MTPKDLREKRLQGSITRADIIKALDACMALQYDNKLTTALNSAYNYQLCESAKAIGMTIKELNNLAMEYFIPSRYREEN